MDSDSPDIPRKQCNACLQCHPKTLEFWHYGKGNADHLRPTCKDCLNARKRHPPIPEGMKKCNTCKQLLPATDTVFIKDHRASNGLGHECRECRSKNWKTKHPPKRQYSIKDGMKKCPACKKWKPLTPEYYHAASNSVFGFHSQCKECRSTNRKQHRDEHPEIYKGYREVHKERRHTDYANRRARKKAVQGTYTAEEISEQLKRQKYKCYYAACGFSKFKRDKTSAFGYAFHIDHTFPISRIVGSDIPANDISYIVLACPECNLKKGKKYPWEWSEGGRLL